LAIWYDSFPALRQRKPPAEYRRHLGDSIVGERFDEFELPLTECDAGDEGEVVSLNGETSVIARLRELGLMPGAHVRIARSGAPMIVEVGNTRLCLRSEDASAAIVRVSICPDEIPAMAGASLNLGHTDFV
jgi:Fe2+ transport system protein FeoA